MSLTQSARTRFLEYRRRLPRAPRLERRTIEARGLSFAVWCTPAVPDATPVCCINGGLLYDHTLLWPALSPLARHRQVVFYDQRGRGASQAPPGAANARIEHDAADVAAIREALGFRCWDLLGHSWGGGIAMLAAECDRAGTRRLVLVSAVGATSGWLAGLHAAALARLTPAARAALQQQDPAALHLPEPGVHSAYSRAMYPAWFADPQLGQAFAPPRQLSLTGAGVASRLRRDGYDWRGLLRAIQARTLILHGEHDLLPASVAHELAALIPGARLVLLAGTGHMPFWEAPEAFFEATEAFLAAS